MVEIQARFQLAPVVHIVPAMLIRLSPMTASHGVLPVSIIKLPVGGRLRFAADPKQGTEGVERIEAPVKAEREFVQVGLEVLVADAVMASAQPTFEIAENEVDDGEVFFRNLSFAACWTHKTPHSISASPS